ncbi:serine/threonine-protein kinase [Stigmatella erecta]|uniref:Serine/threonine protein kinase n=1 Tax=Stigmatella erecta TaxID=83460 RepID=A0A1I0IVF7_9BACT|nr:serine/threonine-protein kinase [Stigmatella erecta]SEU01234.1 serine/threonine protein kinase [Stigmatella erecta]
MTNEFSESPRSLGRYELVHLLGQGGMGEVYLARISGAAGFEKPCIVKTILPALLKDGQFLERFHHEAKVLVHLVHSSIAQVYDMGETDGTYYMALEYVAGVDVAHLAEQSREKRLPLPVPVALSLVQRIAEGLGYAHRKTGLDGVPLGIVHRDVSPHNVMVSYEGEVKVIDFGLAKSAARSKYTLPATVMGKLGYMSPEQARAEPLDHRSDIYSCGVVLWELLAGRPLVPPGTVGEMMAAMAHPTVPSLCEVRPDVSPVLDAVVRRALEPLPHNRYARADEFARALNAQLVESGGAPSTEDVGTFVRAVCPEAFSAQRKLISSLSRERPEPMPPSPTAHGLPAVGVAPPHAPGVGPVELEATTVRPLHPREDSSVPIHPAATLMQGSLDNARSPAGALAPPASASVASPASRRVMVLALGFAAFGLVSASVGATLYFMSGPGERPPAWGEAHPPRPPPFPHAERGPPPGARPPPFQPGSAPPGAPGADPLVATPVRASAEPAPVAHAVDKQPAEPPRPASGEPKAAEPARIKVSNAVQVQARGNGYGVPVGSATGLKPEMVLQVVGPPGPKGLRKVLGQATVEQVEGPVTTVSLDAAALKARGPRFVALPEARPVPAPAEAKARVLEGGAKLSGLKHLNKKITLYNREDEALTNCMATLPGKRRLAVGTLPKGFKDYAWRYVRPHADAPEVPSGTLRLQCTEGSADFVLVE